MTPVSRCPRWAALVAMHLCAFSVGIFGGALFWYVHGPLDVFLLSWGTILSVFGFVITHHRQNALKKARYLPPETTESAESVAGRARP